MANVRYIQVALPWMAKVALAGIAIFAAWRARYGIPDDAFIVLRVVRHWITGYGPYFNVEQHSVQVVTSPLNLLLLGAIAKCARILGASDSGAPILAAQILFFAVLPAAALLSYYLARGQRQGLTAELGGFFAGIAVILISAGAVVVGLETVVVFALTVGALLAFRAERWLLTSSLLGLAFLARHDTAILVGLVTGAYALRAGPGTRVRAALMFLRPFTLIALAWVVYATVAFGKATPDTLAAKMAQGGSPYWLEPYWSGIKGMPQFFSAYYAAEQSSDLYRLLGFAPLLVAILLAVTAFLGKPAPGMLEVSMLILYSIIHLAAYTVMGIPVYHWYFLAYALAISVAAGYGLASLTGKKWGTVLSVVALTMIIVCNGSRLSSSDPRYHCYREIGEYLFSHPANVVGMSEIGIIGYYAPNVEIFDFSGIATPQQRARVAQGRATGWMWEEENLPGKVVVRGIRHPLEPDFDRRFETLYELEKECSDPKMGNVQVWRLRTK